MALAPIVVVFKAYSIGVRARSAYVTPGSKRIDLPVCVPRRVVILRIVPAVADISVEIDFIFSHAIAVLATQGAVIGFRMVIAIAPVVGLAVFVDEAYVVGEVERENGMRQNQ